VPTKRKQLQCFLGFANFYRSFIHNCSVIAAPFTALTSSPSAGHQRWISRSMSLSSGLVLLLSSSSLTPPCSSLCRWMFLTLGWKRCSHKVPHPTVNIPALSSPKRFPQQRGIATWATQSSSPSCGHWRSGTICWRVLTSQSLFGWTTVTSPTCSQRNG